MGIRNFLRGTSRLVREGRAQFTTQEAADMAGKYGAVVRLYGFYLAEKKEDGRARLDIIETLFDKIHRYEEEVPQKVRTRIEAHSSPESKLAKMKSQIDLDIREKNYD